MRFLLRPAWLALIVTVVAFVGACFAVLAPWQFGREAQRDAEQRAIDTSSALAPVPLASLGPVTPAVQWRQVTVTGTYLPQSEVLVRLRSYDGKPASEALTPLRTTDGRVVAVDRGFVREPLPVEPAAASSGAPFTNLSYALQWITFGAIAVFALVYFVRLEMLQRRGAPERRSLRRALSGDDDEPA